MLADQPLHDQPKPIAVKKEHGPHVRVSPTQPRILAGKRADTTRGSNVFSLRHHEELPKQIPTRHAIALGERRRVLVRRRALPAFFQDANYHDQIVKEQNKPAAMQSSPPRMETTPLRPAHDLLRRSLPWTEVRTGDASQKGQRNRIGPQPMISNLNPFTTASASDYLGSISHHSTILPHCGTNPVITSHSAGTDPKPRSNLVKTKFRNRPCQIGRTTEGKLDDLVATVKRLF